MNHSRYLFGEWVEAQAPLTAQEAASICKKADELRWDHARTPMDRVFSVLNKMKTRWENPKDPLRNGLAQKLSKETGFSAEMIDLGLNELASILDPHLLKKKIARELRNFPPFGELHFEPLGTLFHVLSGNVFLVGPGSWIEGALTRNVNILKMSSSEKIFMPIFIRSLQECDEDGILSKSVALIDFDSSQIDVIQEFKNRVDGIVVWGGESAVQGYRNALPARTKLIVFGPKLSFALLTNKGLKQEDFQSVAKKLAAEISVWDQNACTAPQACFVEGKENAKQLANALSLELENTSKILPSGSIEIDAAVEIQKWRSIYEIAQARGEGFVHQSKNLDWTVVVDHELIQNLGRNSALEPSPLHRTIRLVPFDSLESVFKGLTPLRGYLQSCGLLCSTEEQAPLCNSLTFLGLNRVIELGKMGNGEIDDPHDGSYDLPQLMNLVTLRLPKPGVAVDPMDSCTIDARKKLIDERLRVLIHQARKSDFYGERLKNLKIETSADLIQIPVLTREEMDSNMPPRGFGLSTEAKEFVSGGGYVSRSGGSTGEPKFSVYDSQDWEAMISNAVRVFRALGLDASDRLANCMAAGDLYGSFVSFDHVNRLIGVTCFAFGGNVQPKVFAEVYRKFKFTAIEGIPGILVPLLREAKKIEPSLTLEKVIFAGSQLGESDANWMRSELKTQRISSVIGANDGGQLAYQCEKMQGALHHLIDDFNFIEILDEANQAVVDGTPGKVVITSLLKHAYPLIRYEIGDIGRIVPGICDCGRSSRRFEILGRSDDQLSIGVMHFSYRDAKNALSSLPLSQLQIKVRNSHEGEDLYFQIECDDLSKEFEERIKNTLLDRLPKLKEELDSHHLNKMIIQLLPPGTLPRNPRSGKIKEVLDERK